eukprot:11052496-Alexandrium_andersonii.AAC.1
MCIRDRCEAAQKPRSANMARGWLGMNGGWKTETNKSVLVWRWLGCARGCARAWAAPRNNNVTTISAN